MYLISFQTDDKFQSIMHRYLQSSKSRNIFAGVSIWEIVNSFVLISCVTVRSDVLWDFCAFISFQSIHLFMNAEVLTLILAHYLRSFFVNGKHTEIPPSLLFWIRTFAIEPPTHLPTYLVQMFVHPRKKEHGAKKNDQSLDFAPPPRFPHSNGDYSFYVAQLRRNELGNTNDSVFTFSTWWGSRLRNQLYSRQTFP